MKNNLSNTEPKIISIDELWHFYNLPNFMFAITGKNGLIKHVNPTFELLSYYCEKQIRTLTFMELVHASHKPEVATKLNCIHSNNAPLIFTCRMLTADKKYISVQWTVFCPLHNDNLYFIGQVITEKEAAKEDILPYETIFSNNPGPIILIDYTCTQIETANDATVGYSGYTLSELMSLSLTDLFTDNFLAAAKAEEALTPDKKISPPAVTHLIKKSGELIPVEITFSAIHVKEAPYLLLYLKDLTSLQAQQQQLQHALEKEKIVMDAILFGQEKERIEIGKELHDNINQMLSMVKLYQEAALDNESLRIDLLKKGNAILEKTIKEVRDISKSLVASNILDIGLVESVQDLIHSIMQGKNINIQFQSKGFNEALPDKVLIMLFRIIQEQLNNILKHSFAQDIYIEIKQTISQIQLKIQDDGRGFDTQAKKKGIGLRNIISRVNFYKGKVDILSAVGKGCLLLVTIPLAEIVKN